MPIPIESLTVAELLQRFRGDAYLAHKWVTGLPTELVVTDAGLQYPTIAKMMADQQVQTVAYKTNPVFLGSAGLTLPRGTSAQREAIPAPGRLRYNTELAMAETSTAKGWVPLTNIVLQVLRGNVAMVAGTTTATITNSAPLITSGSQLWTKETKQTVPGSEFLIELAGMVDCAYTTGWAGTAMRVVLFMVFRDNLCIGALPVSFSSSGGVENFSMQVLDKPTGSCTYSCRIGIVNGSGTWYVGRTASATLGGVNTTPWKISEYLPL